MMKKVLISICFLLTFNCLSAQEYIGDKEDIDVIKLNITNFSKAVMASDYEAIANSYTTDGKIMPNGVPIIEGRADIKKRWTLPEGMSTSYHKIKPVEIRVLDDYAYDYGLYEGSTLHKDKTTSSWKGKYVIVWKKINGEWKIYLDIWNSINE